MKVLSIDIARREFVDLVVTEIVPSIDNSKSYFELFYETNEEQCISGIMLYEDEFKSFLEGNAIELHKGEIVIIKVD